MDWDTFGRGVTAQEAARHFGWSVGVATEELELAEENGALCREEGVEGLRFWRNWLVHDDEQADDDDDITTTELVPKKVDGTEGIVMNLKASGLL